MKTDCQRISTSVEEIELREIFSLFDFENKGEIGGHEFKAALQGLGFGVTNEEVVALLNGYGKKPSDLVTMDEFCCMMRGRLPSMQDPKEARRLFNLLDLDGTGVITFQSLKKVAKMCSDVDAFTDEELQFILTEGAKDKQNVTFEEFYRILKAHDSWLSDDE